MITQFKDYSTTKAYTESTILPRGGYVCKIIGAKVMPENQFGQSIKIAFDIAEGEYAGYYQAKFDANTNEDKKWPGVYMLNVPTDDGSEKDGWTKRRFRTFTDALEESNAGYHFDWDETKFKDKLIGFIFNYREWENSQGNTIMVPNAKNVTSVQKIRDGKYKIPDDKLLSGSSRRSASRIDDSFIDIPEGVMSDEVPF